MYSKKAAWAGYRQMVEGMWAEGMTAREIAEALGHNPKHAGAYIAQKRARGYDLPHRRSDALIARVTEGNAKIAHACEVYRAQQAAAA